MHAPSYTFIGAVYHSRFNRLAAIRLAGTEVVIGLISSDFAARGERSIDD